MGRLMACAWLALAAPALVSAQSTQSKSLGPGKLLVASRGLGDPNFAETVVLIIHYDDEGVVGLVINRRSKIPLARALEDLRGATGRTDTIYVGGPVGRTGIMALVRSKTKLDDAERIVGDVYLITRAELLAKTLSAGTASDLLHVFVGYAGWTKEQLEGEVELGAWYIFSGDAAEIFAARPDSVWERLIQKTEDQVALVAR